MHPRKRLLVRWLLLASLLVQPTTAIGQKIRLPGASSKNNNNNNNNKKPTDETTAVAAVAGTATAATTTVSTVIAGKLRAFWQTLKRADLSQIHKGLNHALDWGDVLWVGAVGWCTEPISRFVFTNWIYSDDGPAQGGEDDDSSAASVAQVKETAYKKTWLFRVASTVGQLGRVMGLVYATDVTTLLMHKLGFALPEGVNRRVANLLYALFGAQKFRQLKTWMLRRWFDKHHTGADLVGRERAVDLIVDGTIVFLLFFMIQDIFSVTMGRSLQSLFAIGGISGIMISLASKGKKAEFVFLYVSDTLLRCKGNLME